MEVQNYVLNMDGGLGGAVCEASLRLIWNIPDEESEWKPFSLLTFGGLTANCCAAPRTGGSSVLLRCITPSLPVGVRNVEVKMSYEASGFTGDGTGTIAIGSFGVSGRVLLSALKPVSSAEVALDEILSYGPMSTFESPDDQETGPAGVLTSQVSLMVFEVAGLNERIISAADVKLVMVRDGVDEELVLRSAIILSSSADTLRMVAQLDLLDGQTGVFHAKFYVRNEVVATRNSAVQAGLSMPAPASIAPYTTDAAYIRFANVTSGPTSGGTFVEVDLGGNFHPGAGLTVSMKGEANVPLSLSHWTNEAGKTVVYFKTSAWAQGIARIQIADKGSGSITKVVMLFEFVLEAIAVDFVEPRYGYYKGFPFAVGISGLPSTVTAGYFEVYVGSVDSSPLTVKGITLEGTRHILEFDAPERAMATEWPLVIKILKGSPQLMVHHLQYLDRAGENPSITSVSRSVLPLQGGVRVRVMLNNLPIVKTHNDIILQIHDNDTQAGLFQTVSIDPVAFLSSETGTVVEFDCPDLSVFGEGAVTVKIWGCPDQKCVSATKNLEVEDPMRVYVVDFAPRFSAIGGGTSIYIRLKGLQNIMQHELQIVTPTARLAVDEIVDHDPFSGVTLARFTTLSSDAGIVQMQVVPYGLTSERFSPAFDLVYSASAGSTQVATLTPEVLPVDEPTVLSMFPSSGSVNGGYPVTAYIGPVPAGVSLDSVRVLFAGKLSVPAQISLDQSGTLKLILVAPSHIAGNATLSMFLDGVLFTSQTQTPISSIFSFVSDDGIVILDKAIPAVGPLEGGTPVAVTLKNCPAGLSAASFAIHISGNACAVKMVLQVSSGVCRVYFRTGRMSVPGMKQGTVTLKLPSSKTFSAQFPFRFHQAQTQASISFAFPAEGAARGGTPVLVILQKTILEQVSLEALVIRVAGAYAAVDNVISLSETSVEIAFLTPAFACAQVACIQPVEITSLLNPDLELGFDFEYQSQVAYVSEVLPSAVPDTGGSIISVTIRNFPIVYFVDEVEVHFSGLGLVLEPSNIIASGAAMTVLEFKSPSTAGNGMLDVDLVPVFNRDKVVRFPIDVYSLMSPSIVSLAPSSSPSGYATLVSVVIDRYPIRPPGSLDKNFKSIAGPAPAILRINGAVYDGIVEYTMLQGGVRTEDTRTQIAFQFQYDFPGLAHVEIIQDVLPWKTLVRFEVDVFNATMPHLIYAHPTTGVTTGNTVLVDIGNFGLASALDIQQVVAAVDDRLCEVLGIQIFGFVTSLRLKMPNAPRSKTSRVTVSAKSVSASVSFLFEYADACVYDEYCASVGRIPDVASLSTEEPRIQCDPGLCVNYENLPLPAVLPGVGREGLTAGGDTVVIFVSDLETFKSSDILVSFAGVASPSVSLHMLDHNLARLSIVTPYFPRAGNVGCVVESLHRPSVVALFDFTYYDTPVEAGNLTFSPPGCFEGETVVFTGTVMGWSPVSLDATIELNSTNLANPVSILSDDVIKSKWLLTKFSFRYTCSMPVQGESVYFFTKHPTTGLQSSTSSIFVRPREFSLTSVFPRKGPEAGGYSVLVTFTGAQIQERGDIVKTIAKQGNASVDLTCFVRSSNNGTGVISVTLPSMDAGIQEFIVVPRDYPNATFSFTAEPHYEGVGPPLLLAALPSEGTKFGGTVITVKVAGMATVDTTQPTSIVVNFGARPATVKKIRQSTSDLTVLDVIAPDGFAGLAVSVLVSPAALTSFVEASVSFVYTYVNPGADLTLKRGSTLGGTLLNATVYGFPLMDLTLNIATLGARFGSTAGKVVRIVTSEVESAVLEVIVPAVVQSGVVSVVFTALLSGQSSETTYEYYQKPVVALTHPQSGSMNGGFPIRMAVNHFPIVYSVTQVIFSCSGVKGTVREIVYSNVQESVFKLVAPALLRAGLVSCMLEPLDSSLRAESSVTFSYDALPEATTVVVEEDDPILAYTETVRHLVLYGLDPLLELQRPMLRFEIPGKGRYTIGAVHAVQSDGVSSKMQIEIPSMPPGVYLAEIFWGYASALFRLEVRQAQITANVIASSEGPVSGGTIMTIAVYGIAQSLSPDDYIVEFGGSFGTVRRVTLFRNSTLLEVISPAYVSLVKDGAAPVLVEGYAKQDPTNAFSLDFVYHQFETESGVLSIHGNSIEIIFSQDTVHASEQSQCSDFFDGATLSKIGNGAACYWFEPRHLTVSLGSSPTIVPGNVGTLLDFQHAYSGRGQAPATLPFTLEANEVQMVPTGRILGPSQLSRCDAGEFIAAVTSARALDYLWSCSAALPSDGTQMALDSLLSGVHGDRVEIDAQELTVGVTYTISVQITNFLGMSTGFQKIFTVVDEPIPTAFVQNQDYVTGTDAYSFGVRATGSKCMATKEDLLAGCPFDSHMGTVPSDLVYAWYKTIGGTTEALTGISGGQFTEKYPRVGQYMTYEVEVFSRDYAGVYALISTTIFVKPSNLEAIVYGGDRLATTSNAIQLTGQNSVDPDVMSGAALSYSWKCSVGGYPCRSPHERLLTFPNQPNVAIAANMLHADQVYHIELTVKSADGRSASKVVEIQTTEISVHVMTIAREMDRLDAGYKLSTYNVGESVLLVAKTIPGDPSLVWTGSPSIEWGVNRPSVNLLDPAKFPFGAFQSTLLVGGTVLKPGSDFIFSASLLDNAGRAFFKIHKDSINVGPNGGSCKLQPAVGVALKTKFLASCSGFEDMDGVKRLYFSLKKDTERLILPSTILSEMELDVLPVGTFTVLVTIMDNKGASTLIETNEAVVEQESAQNIFERCKELLDEAKATNDMSTSLLYITAVASTLKRLQEEQTPLENAEQLSDSMSSLILDIAQRNALAPEQSLFLLGGINQILIEWEVLTVESVHRLGLVLEKIAIYDVLGMANMNTVLVDAIVSVLEKLSARARVIRKSGNLGVEEETTIENNLQRLADVGLKAALVYNDTVQQEFYNPNTVLYGRRISLLGTKGATITVPDHPDLAVKFPGSLSVVGAGDDDLLDVQFSYRKGVVALGSTETGLTIVSGTVGVTLSKAAQHAANPNYVSMGDGTVEISIPVNTAELSDVDTDAFFDLQKVQCVYWKDAAINTSRLDFGRWSNVGCKATSVTRKLDASGFLINSLGLVTCQCNHLTHFAVGFGETKVRFLEAPGSSRSGDVYQVQSGDQVSFDVDVVNELGASMDVGILSLTPAGRSFTPLRFAER